MGLKTTCQYFLIINNLRRLVSDTSKIAAYMVFKISYVCECQA